MTVTGGKGLRCRLLDGETVFGASCMLGSPAVAEAMAGADLDFVYIDQQHGLTSFDTLVAVLRAFGRTKTVPLVRVLSNDLSLIGQALDAGAEGVIIPMVNSREDAERAAASCRYAPVGRRSFGPVRAGLLHGRDPLAANERVLCLVMIETAEGVAAAKEIASTPGIDGVYIGQADLALTLGLQPLVQIQPGIHQDAIQRIGAACDEAGIVRGINGSVEEMVAAGYRLITIGSDVAILNRGLEQLRQRQAQVSGSHYG